MKFKTSFFTASVFIFYLGERKIYQIKTYTLFNRDDVRRFLMLWLYYTTNQFNFQLLEVPDFSGFLNKVELPTTTQNQGG